VAGVLIGPRPLSLPLFIELPARCQRVEKVTAGPIDGPGSGQKCQKSVFWCPIWVRSGAPQEFFNSLLKFSEV
jgi:hypothetical protein